MVQWGRRDSIRSDRSWMRTDGSKAWPAAWCITNQSSASSPLGNSTASLIFAARTFAHADAAEKRKAPQKIPCLKVCQFIKYRLRSCRAYTHLTDTLFPLPFKESLDCWNQRILHHANLHPTVMLYWDVEIWKKIAWYANESGCTFTWRELDTVNQRSSLHRGWEW